MDRQKVITDWLLTTQDTIYALQTWLGLLENWRIAVGDLGQGIRGSLTAKHGEFGQEPLDYLRAAMGGRSARLSGRGGMGLRRVEQIVEAEGGYLWLRSETAAILSHGPGKIEERNDLVYVPGTQVAVELHAPYHD
jgi:hypothetical protein